MVQEKWPHLLSYWNTNVDYALILMKLVVTCSDHKVGTLWVQVRRSAMTQYICAVIYLCFERNRPWHLHEDNLWRCSQSKYTPLYQFPSRWLYTLVTILVWSQIHHYSDVIMGMMAFQITNLTIVYSTLYPLFRRSSKFIKAPRHWLLWGEFTGDRWIPRSQGQ